MLQINNLNATVDDKRNQTPVPFRGGVGGGNSPPSATLQDQDMPNPSTPEGEGLQVMHEFRGISLEGSVG